MAQKIVATIGSFDGVHRGHRLLLDELIALAQERTAKSLVISFTHLPARVLQPEQECAQLSTATEKERLLHELGIDEVILLDFTQELAQLCTREFLRDYIRSRWGVDVLLMGYDHSFGSDRTLSFGERLGIAQELGIELLRSSSVACSGEVISSSRIRTLLQHGEVAEANKLLGYNYQLSGIVVKGKQIGRTIGYPTANVSPDDAQKLLPTVGVYAVRVYLGEEHKPYMGMLYIGNRPTVSGEGKSIEVNLFDFAYDLYGERITLEFVAFVRGESKFEGLDALKAQLALDELRCRELLLGQ